MLYFRIFDKKDFFMAIEDIPEYSGSLQGITKCIVACIQDPRTGMKKIVLRSNPSAELHSDICIDLSFEAGALGLSVTKQKGEALEILREKREIRILRYGSRDYDMADAALMQPILQRAFPEYKIIIGDAR
jgi:hypothetical protein